MKIFLICLSVLFVVGCAGMTHFHGTGSGTYVYMNTPITGNFTVDRYSYFGDYSKVANVEMVNSKSQ